MATLNKVSTRTVVPARRTSPIVTGAVPNTRTALGGVGFLPADAKGELLDLGVSLFAGGEKTFHESGAHRDSRFAGLIEEIAPHDGQWSHDFLVWLRSKGNIRTASVMGAAHAVRARLLNGAENSDGWNRKIVSDVPVRLDDVKEFAAYWTTKFGAMPKCVKRGLSDAIGRLTNEYSYMKYGIQGSDAWTLPDVIDMVHAKPAKPFQANLFGYALADRHGNLQWDGDVPFTLKHNEPVYFYGLNTIMANRALRQAFNDNPSVLLNPEELKNAGFTWEDALSLAGTRVDKAKLWESLIFSGSVPVFAALRNLRNMEQAGISREAMKKICDLISSPEVIAKSHLFPYNIWAAHKESSSVHWTSALDDALTHSTANVPSLPGRTLVLVDSSGSMVGRLSNNSSMDRREAAAIFAGSLYLKNAGRCNVFTFSNSPVEVKNLKPSMSLVSVVDEIMRVANANGGGTETAKAVRSTFKNHDRVVILTDEQSAFSAYGSVASQVPADTFMYSFDLAGYRASDIPSGRNRKHQLFGLTDGSFKMIPLLERGQNAGWPWETEND